MIQDSKAKGAIGFIDWYRFFKFGAGSLGILMTLISSANSSGLLIYLNYTVGEWANEDSKEAQQDPFYINVFM